jgi:hypothetical protein
MEYCMQMMRKPVKDEQSYNRIWNEHVLALKGTYTMSA